jgi:hypothetical protein
MMPSSVDTRRLYSGAINAAVVCSAPCDSPAKHVKAPRAQEVVGMIFLVVARGAEMVGGEIAGEGQVEGQMAAG